jgi:hypothetical protein
MSGWSRETVSICCYSGTYQIHICRFLRSRVAFAVLSCPPGKTDKNTCTSTSSPACANRLGGQNVCLDGTILTCLDFLYLKMIVSKYPTAVDSYPRTNSRVLGTNAFVQTGHAATYMISTNVCYKRVTRTSERRTPPTLRTSPILIYNGSTQRYLITLK